jgi:triacylglycerol lipase
MKNYLLLILLCFSSPLLAGGNLMVLVHGYASYPGTWEFSGINQILRANGWKDATGPYVGDNVFYTAALPAQAPLTYQAGMLLAQLQRLRASHPDKNLILVGHSAGGVVSRLVVLNGNPARVAHLVTIAAPNLGTPRASQGLHIVEDKPFFCPGPGWRYLKSNLGGNAFDYLEDSKGMLYQLLPPQFNSLIARINLQPHPDIKYDAIVRRYGDLLVPALSQDLNNVPALRGRSRVWLTDGGHFLSPYDGQLLVKILAATHTG